MFYTHQSNRLEKLFSQLTQVVATPLADVFAAETILVQSQGMARWLSLELAKRVGIAANIECPFPASYIWRLFQRLDPNRQPSIVSPYDPQSLTWSVLAALKGLESDPDFTEIRGFLEVGGGDLRGVQLAEKIALLLDQYLMHRPDWIRAWDRGEILGNIGSAERWQAKIWRAITKEHGADRHRVALFDRFMVACDEDFLQAAGVPERLCLFGIPALSQLHLDLFVQLSNFIDVHLFLLTPCAEFTDDLIDVRRMERLKLHGGEADPAMNYYELGCPLLMSLGGMGLEFAAMLNAYELLGAAPDALYEEPKGTSALEVIHRDLLRGTAFGAEETGAARQDNDRSIQVHSAHSPMREVEILHDSLLELLNSNLEIQTSDIIVMVPEISQYAPLIEAVFSTALPPETMVPYTIADQSGTDVVVLAFMELLGVVGARFAASELLALLDREPIRQRFGITVEEIFEIRHWVGISGIRWGRDKEQRGTDREDEAVGTWQNGLDRLMLGFAMPGGSQAVVGGILPCDGIEGGTVEVLSKLLSFYSALRQLAERCSRLREIGAWRVELAQALDQFFMDRESNYFGMQRVRSALEDLERSYGAAKVAVPVSLEVVAGALEKKMVVSRDHHFLAGRVTFCQMVPMRSIPFKVICLLGMNDAAFPRQDRQPEFDLMKGRARAGDRCRRDDDRYLFLETLLSARQTLYISYVGQKDTDHRQIPPSSVVSELLDYLADRLGRAPRFLTRDALQPFSKRYFSGELPSYSAVNQEIATALTAEKSAVGFFAEQVGPEVEMAVLELNEVIQFFQHPVKALMRSRYDLYLDEYHEPVEDRSCFALESLDQYRLAVELSEEALAGGLDVQGAKRHQLAGALPQGVAGAYFYEQGIACAHEVQSQFDRHVHGAGREPLTFSLDLDGVRLTGTLQDMNDSGQYLYRPTKGKNIGHRDLMNAWIRHLVLCAVRGSGTTIFICRDGGRLFPYYDKAVAELSKLLALYRLGQQRPLPLLPRSSFAYARRMWGMKKGPGDPQKARAEAENVWRTGGFMGRPEQQDHYLSLVYQGDDLFTPTGETDFFAVAEAVLSVPLLHGEELS